MRNAGRAALVAVEAMEETSRVATTRGAAILTEI